MFYTHIWVPKPSKKCLFFVFYSQLNQALAGKFNAHVHVEYEWCLQHEDLDESDEDLDEKVKDTGGGEKSLKISVLSGKWVFKGHCLLIESIQEMPNL